MPAEDIIPTFVDADENEIQSRFINAARSIMLSHELVRGEQSWQITALELYVYNQNWRDTNTHRSAEQLRSGTWYIHPKSMNRSGIDITAGTASSQVYAGFLIRELDKRDGPGKVIKTIVRSDPVSSEFSYRWSEAEQVTLGQIRGQSIWSGELYLRKCKAKADELWIGPRLNLKHSAAPWNASLRISTWETEYPEGMKRI